MTKKYKWTMNLMVGRGSLAESIARKWTEAPVTVEPAALAAGIPETPDHDLRFRGGKTIPQLSFTNFFVGGNAALEPY